MKFRLFLACFLVQASAEALGQSAAIAVYCFDDNEGANIYANGSFIGQCSQSGMIGEVQPGDVRVKAVKPAGPDHERTWFETLKLGNGGLTKVIVKLNGPELTLEAKTRMEREKSAKEKAVAEVALRNARAGDIDAMKEVAGYYSRGEGLVQSQEKARYWTAKAKHTEERKEAERIIAKARSGDIRAMRELVVLYHEGRGVEHDRGKALAWRQKADALEAERMLDLAENGNSEAMKKISEMYKDGVGVKQDTEKAGYWITRYREEQGRQRREREREAARKAMEEIRYFDKTGRVHNFLWAWDGNPWITNEHVPTGGKMFMSTFGPYLSAFAYPGAFTTDAAVAPTKLSEYRNLERSLAARTATFGNPESAVATAYRNQKNRH